MKKPYPAGGRLLSQGHPEHFMKPKVKKQNKKYPNTEYVVKVFDKDIDLANS